MSKSIKPKPARYGDKYKSADPRRQKQPKPHGKSSDVKKAQKSDKRRSQPQ